MSAGNELRTRDISSSVFVCPSLSSKSWLSSSVCLKGDISSTIFTLIPFKWEAIFHAVDTHRHSGTSYAVYTGKTNLSPGQAVNFNLGFDRETTAIASERYCASSEYQCTCLRFISCRLEFGANKETLSFPKERDTREDEEGLFHLLFPSVWITNQTNGHETRW